MGKVVNLSAARKRRGFQPGAATIHDGGSMPRARWLRTIGRGAKSVSLTVLRALAIGVVEVVLTTLFFLRRPGRVLFRFGFIGVALVVAGEGLNHWRDRQLLLWLGAIALAALLTVGFYEGLISLLFRVKQTLQKDSTS